MNGKTDRRTGTLRAFVLSAMLAAGPALADKPDWAGKAKQAEKSHAKADKGDRRDDRRDDRRAQRYFSDRQRVLVREYYVDEFRRGHCPPGLAKKRNGCMPPGKAKKWRVGQRLPRTVAYVDPPAAIVIELGAPPALHRYVRVGADILLIAVGTGIVIDAIEDLGRM